MPVCLVLVRTIRDNLERAGALRLCPTIGGTDEGILHS